MTHEDSAAGQLLACVLLSGIPPLELQGAEWDFYDGAAGKIELTCQEEDIYETYTLSRPAMDLLHKLRGHFPFTNYVFHHDGEIVFLDEIINAFERIAARAEMRLVTMDDLLLSYQYIAFAGALFDAERCCGTA